MFRQLFTILAGILALIGAGAISYTYLEQTVGPRETTQGQGVSDVVAKKEVAKPATTQAVQKKVAVKTPAITNGSLVSKTAVVEKTVVTPGPLRAVEQAPTTTTLTVKGVIEQTNIARAQNGGLPALVENSTLDSDAQMKVNDMFAKQYFEHVSPAPYNVGPSDLAKAVGYAYIIVGENLALGDFDGDQGVVTAWMNSTGHRANILNTHYQEIGVAVGKGMYEGRVTWLAVQSFGLPLSACPSVDTNLRVQIDTNNENIASLKTQLEAKKAQIDATPQNDHSYNTYVNEYNAIVREYNPLVTVNRTNVEIYNAGVKVFNDCINAATQN